jgi:hypothetical protein
MTKTKRTLALRRRAIRKALLGSLLIAVLAVETLTMTQVYRGLSSAPVRRETSIDPALCFRGL